MNALIRLLITVFALCYLFGAREVSVVALAVVIGLPLGVWAVLLLRKRGHT